MAQSIISGPGVPLPYPQSLYPSDLYGAPIDINTNRIDLAAGDSIAIPAGSNFVDPGLISVIQWLDPVTGIWRGFDSARGLRIIQSNGFNYRVANLTGCPVAAIVSGGGSGFTQATATITANAGGSTWQPIVGGNLSVSTIANPGASFTVPPLIVIPAPPSPGVPATGRATLANGTVSAVTLTNVGAGYTGTVTAYGIPVAADPNYGTATPATITLILNAAFSGAITAALCTFNGAAVASVPTLTAAGGGGSGATVVASLMRTCAGTSIVAGGGGWGVAAAPGLVTSVDGGPASVSAIGNPLIELTSYLSRPARFGATSNSGGTITALTSGDPGLFVGLGPTAVIIPGGTLPATLASITFTTLSGPDSILLQPL